MIDFLCRAGFRMAFVVRADPPFLAVLGASGAFHFFPFAERVTERRYFYKRAVITARTIFIFRVPRFRAGCVFCNDIFQGVVQRGHCYLFGTLAATPALSVCFVSFFGACCGLFFVFDIIVTERSHNSRLLFAARAIAFAFSVLGTSSVFRNNPFIVHMAMNGFG